NVTLKEAIESIESQTDYKFLYREDLIDINKKTSIEKKEETCLEDLMSELLDDSKIDYNVFNGNLIVLSPLQNLSVSGKVTDAVTGEPLPGVNVIVEGTSIGAVTDLNGKYQINVPDENSVLVFSFVGYLSENIIVGNKSAIDLVLTPDVTQLDEVVVIGYGTQKKADVTSSVATVKSDNFIKGSVTDAGQLIQGKVAGLTVIMPSSDPTGRTQILLRGNTSLMGQNQDPLILIDGIPGDMKTVAPQDIESIDVLKDGSAAAIYGTRGTNGVILITTKRASGNISSVEYSTYLSTRVLTRKLNMSGAADFRAQMASGDRAVIADDGTVTYPMDDNGANTDWVKEISQNPLIHNHNLTFRSGSNVTNYLINLNYNKNPGVFKKSYSESFSGRIDFNHNMFDNKVKINLNLFNSTSDWWGFNWNTYYQALKQNPTSPVTNADGTWFQELLKFEYQSPVSNIYESDGKYNNQIGRYKGSITFIPIEGLKITGIASYSRNILKKGYFETKQHASTLRDNRNGYANIEGDGYIDWLAELTTEYSKSIGKHNFMILGGYSYQNNMHDEYYMENWDFPTDRFGWDNIELGRAVVNGDVAAPMWSNKWKTNLIGFFGRLTYNYADKYLFLASIRREAASQLYGTNDPWGTFPAISAGWRITKESFMSGQTLFSDIKLRAGYGATGSQPSDLFRGVSILGYGSNIYSDGKWIKAIVPIQNANPDLKWEEKHETDFGIDFALLDNRISGSVDYYFRRIKNLLWLFEVPSPPNLYNRTLANVGEMENKGIEIMMNFVPVKKSELEWNTSISYSTNTNKLVSLSNDLYQSSTDYIRVGAIFPPIQTFSHLLRVGGSVGDFYGYKVIDIGNDPADKANYGQWVYEGVDGNPVKYTDYKHSFEEKKVIGNGIPKFYLGWNNTFRYKNIDLNITQRGAFGFQVANLNRMMFENPRMKQYNVLTTAFDDVYGKTQLQSIPEFNSYYIENGDYWKIDNIVLGYNLKNTGIKYIQSARLYVSVLNAFIITGYKGIDPEVSLRNPTSYAQSGVVQVPTSGLDPGMDSPNNYPTARTFTIGLNVTF
ncbi:MAG: SusC/RagA family TonB-linked outer membrane protein, partial [Bacteroidales bacterium]|nr:SusC/RagA family TonB-linked outer membrane protein [Bacteroidales bacterium]